MLARLAGRRIGHGALSCCIVASDVAFSFAAVRVLLRVRLSDLRRP